MPKERWTSGAFSSQSFPVSHVYSFAFTIYPSYRWEKLMIKEAKGDMC